MTVTELAEPPQELHGLFARARRRLRTIWVVATSSAYAPWVGLAALLVALIGWVRPWSWPEPVALGLLIVSVVALLVGAFALRLPSPAVARALDRGLETDDALITALQFAPTDAFGPRVHARANQYAHTPVDEALPVPWRPQPLMIAAGLALAAVAAIVFTNPQDSVREQLAADQQAIEELAEEFEELAEELETAPDATAETDAIAEQLAALAEALRESDDLETATDELTETQEELLRSIDADDLSQRAASQGLERTLSANPLADGGDAAAQLEALSAGLGELTEEERAALAERLEELAETQAAGDAETAEALAEAAEALAAGDAQAAQAALAAASASASNAAAGAAATAQAQAAAAAAGQAADGLADRAEGQGEGQGQGQGEGQGQGQGQGEGEGQGEGQGEGEGQGQGQGQGEGGAGGGMNATGNNPSGRGQQAAVDGSGNQGEGPAAPPPDTPVLIPRDGESDTSDAQVDVSGEGVSETDQRVAGTTGSGVSQVPLESIANDYANRATEALDGTNISSSEASNVKNYFDALTDTSEE